MRISGRGIVLAVLLVTLAAVIAQQWRQGAAEPGLAAVGAAAGSASGSPRRNADPPVSAVPSLRLDALQAAQAEPAPTASARNLFQFQLKPPPPPPVAPATPLDRTAAMPGAPSVPAEPPPPPPISLKFIGIVQAPNQKLAVLTNTATRDVFYGREGEIIDGRYRILRIGVESIEMAYVDGRGRQTIRLTGS